MLALALQTLVGALRHADFVPWEARATASIALLAGDAAAVRAAIPGEEE
eukprot:SAG31_NODE_9132_length_1328_cov_1.684296_1_plen_48_part_10